MFPDHGSQACYLGIKGNVWKIREDEFQPFKGVTYDNELYMLNSSFDLKEFLRFWGRLVVTSVSLLSDFNPKNINIFPPFDSNVAVIFGYYHVYYNITIHLLYHYLRHVRIFVPPFFISFHFSNFLFSFFPSWRDSCWTSLIFSYTLEDVLPPWSHITVLTPYIDILGFNFMDDRI